MKESHSNLDYNAIRAEYDSLQSQYDEAQAQITALMIENQALKKRLSAFAKPVASGTSSVPGEKEGEVVRMCENCGQGVPAGNYDMHSLHCQRVNKKCQVCGLIIPTAEFQAHFQGLKEDVEGLFKDAETGDIPGLEARFKHGMDVNSVDSNKNSALHISVRSGNVQIVDFLLRKGFDINRPNSYGETPLHIALEKKTRKPEMLAFLLKNGADPMALNRLGDSPYALTMRQGDPALMLIFTQSSQGQISPPQPSTPGPKTASGRFRAKYLNQ